MKRLTIVLTALILLAVMATSVSAAPSGWYGTPYFVVTRVDPNAYVYLRLYNFPQGTQVKVYEDLYGTAAVNGALVGGFDADSTIEFRVEMAPNIHGQARGAIRLVADGINISGYFLNVSGGSTTTTTTTGTTTLSYVPTFSITDVVVDSTVTITTANFPASDTFDVLMNTYGTLGIGGTYVTSVSSGSGGSLSFTFDIPSGLYGLSKIAIRLQSPTSGYYSYNWFHNNTSSGSTTTTTTTTTTSNEVVPIFWIDSVSKDNTVTIHTTSLASGYTYDVYMNNFGTAGIGGTKVDTITSAGGVQTFTFSIPSGLQGLSRIAIRLVSPTSGFFGYNWFWNSTYP